MNRDHGELTNAVRQLRFDLEAVDAQLYERRKAHRLSARRPKFDAELSDAEEACMEATKAIRRLNYITDRWY